MSSTWFDVDREGLSKLIERRGKHWLFAELLQNAWDAPGTTKVQVSVLPDPGAPFVRIRVEDDSPAGFVNLDHAFTLFAESVKKGNPELRGRFNFGEKLVLALANEARVVSTTGSVHFGPDGRSVSRAQRTSQGTVFEARVRMTRAELADALEKVRDYLPPIGINTVLNGETLAGRIPHHVAAGVQLATEVASEDGVLRRSRRSTRVEIYTKPEHRAAMLYEMGIPVMELPDDAFDVNVCQRVPLSFERDSVSAAYLREVRARVLDCVRTNLSAEQSRAAWVSDALDGPCSDDAVRAVVIARYGDKAVSFDPSDPEANHRAASQGFTVVHGGAFTAEQWARVRESSALSPAGRVTPTPTPFSPGGEPAQIVDRNPDMEAFAEWVEAFGTRLIGKPIQVEFLARFNSAAAYGGQRVSFNVGRLGKAWFAAPLREHHLDLVLHELAHEYASNHLSDDYFKALSRLGAKATMLAIESPELFEIARAAPVSAPSRAIGMR